eukprot:scaffold96287_cov15-Tisochrysis_lutea.AAC.1
METLLPCAQSCHRYESRLVEAAEQMHGLLAKHAALQTALRDSASCVADRDAKIQEQTRLSVSASHVDANRLTRPECLRVHEGWWGSVSEIMKAGGVVPQRS